MKPEHYRRIRKEKPKPKSRISRSKSRMVAVAKEWKPITSPELREVYSTKTEWAKRLLPTLKEEQKPLKEKK